MATYLNEVLSGLQVVHTAQAQSFNEALGIFAQQDCHGVSYTEQQEYILNNVEVLEARNGIVTFTVPMSRKADLCSNFESNVPIEVCVGDEVVDGIDTVVMTNSRHNRKDIRFLLPQNNRPEKITLRYKVTFFNNDVRCLIQDTPDLISGSLLYSNNTVRNVNAE
jgi:hypothetical protein